MFNIPGFLIKALRSGHLSACSYISFAKSSRFVLGRADTGRFARSLDEKVCFAYGLLLRFDRGKSYF